MTAISVVCTLLLGCTALVQSCRAMIAQRSSKVMSEKLARAQDRYVALGLAIERAHIACIQQDGPALVSAVREANRVMADPMERRNR